ncbi:Glycosyl transferase family 2 [Geodermatophilus saharensis]|uniref:Glycosyl transferase family 2 n=1 Tax=Geodermatophilus saharensis TaxID=1137994 RepID=A0A239I990_9ACTN|nr:glycosyltransferase family A protein [Geodermatophilus saharensis]SNS90190.1 Glycosyl transferase family 2 [Geodermatophilus saharensis]
MTDWLSHLRAPAPAAPVDPGPLPTLSVLIPAYNAADTIGEALESVLTQLPAPLEVVVSDDGSEDDLTGVLAGFGERVRVVRGPNRGLATARNRAAAAARGELLGLLDADDVWLPGRAAALTEAAAARPDLSIVTTDAWVTQDGRPDPASYYGLRHFEVDDQEEYILRENFVFGAGAVRARALAEVGGYDPVARWAEDWDLWLRLIHRGHRAGMVDVPLYEYRRRTGSLSNRKVDLALGVLAVLERARPLLSDERHAAVLARTEREWRVSAARFARQSRDPRRRRLVLAALRTKDQPLGARALSLAYGVVPSRIRRRPR